MAQLTHRRRERRDRDEATRRRAYRVLLVRRLAAGQALADAVSHGLPDSVQSRFRESIARLDTGLGEHPEYAGDVARVQESDLARAHAPGGWSRHGPDEMPCLRCLIRIDGIPEPR
jgi:hypothetical protein